MLEQELPETTGNEELGNQEVEEVVNDVQLTQEEINERNRLAYEAYMKGIEEARIPLNTSSSEDVINRVNAIVSILTLKITIPKTVTETLKGQQPYEKITGVVELSFFPHYGDTSEAPGVRDLVNQNYGILINRLADLSKLL